MIRLKRAERWFFLVILLIAQPGCEKEFDKYYKVPDDLIGTILDVLQKDGNYTQFCKAVEMADFADVLGKTGNFTVFAPDDKAFEAYFQESGYSSLEQIPAEKLKELVMYHIVFWSYSRFKLLYGLGVEDQTITYSTDNFRKETRCKVPVTTETDLKGKSYSVYHDYKFVPVYSSEYFTEHNLDGASNYTFFYPNTSFTGLNVDRAEVTEYDVPAQNGWIHRINKVLVPPDNLEDILNSHAEFSTFKSLLNQRAVFSFNYQVTTAQKNSGDVNNDGKLDSLFQKLYELYAGSYALESEDVDGSGQNKMFTVFAPTNSALQEFFVNHTKGYSSIDEIGDFWMDWYLNHYIGSAYWPSKLSTMTENWEWNLTKNTEPGNIEQGDIAYSQMASNGPFYGINKYLLPKVFETAAKPIFGDKNYEWFCDLLVYYMVDILLDNEDINFTIFAPSNAAMSAAGYSARNGLGGFGLYQSQNPLTPVSRSIATDIIKSHLVFGKLSKDDLKDGTFIKTVQNTYIGVTSTGIYGGGDPAVAAVGDPDNSGINGVLYPIDRMLVSPSNSIFQILSNASGHPEYSEFYKLLLESGLVLMDDSYNPVSLSNIATGIRYTCFIPTNDAITQAKSLGLIPTDQEELQQFLRYHFMEGTVFSDGQNGGTFKTTRYADDTHTTYTTIDVLNEKDNLRVEDHQGNIRNVVSANTMATNGIIHSIDSVLIY